VSRARVVETRLTGWRAGLVWLAAGSSIAVMIVGLVVNSVVGPLQPDEPVLVVAALVLLVSSLGTVGALITTRQRRNPIGWILWLSAFLLGFGAVVRAYVTASIATAGGDLPGTAWLGWLLGFLFTPALGALLIILPLLFPSGHLLSRRWRWVVALALAVAVADTLTTAFLPGPLEGDDRLLNPVGIEAVGNVREIAEAAAGLGLAILLPLVLLSLVLRYRRGSRIERQQLKWFAAAVVLTGACFAIALLPFGPLPIDFWVAWIVALPLIPLAIGIAVLRYRLYEIDRIISRTLSWALVTGCLVAAFVALVIALTAVLGSIAGGSTLAVAGSTLVVFALFQPLRRWIQNLVDRRFDRARYDAERTAAAFAMRLRDDVDLASVQGDLLGVVHASLQPASLGAWMRARPGGPG